MKKVIIGIVILSIVLYGFFKFYLEERYIDTLHTDIKFDDFSTDFRGIEEMATEYVKSYHIPSLSIAIIENADVVKFISKGTLSKKDDTPTSEKTIYRIASTGKMLIAIITQQLVDEGILKVDDSILKYLGNQINEDKKTSLQNVTIENILLHNSGLGRDWKAFSEQDIIDELNHNELEFKVGERWAYSNFGYAALTLILEKATALTYHQLLDKYVKQKFELDHVSTVLTEKDEAQYAKPYLPEFRFLNGEDKDYGKQTLTSGIYTNVESLTDLLVQQIGVYQLPDSLNSKSPLILNREKITAFREKSFYGYGIFEQEFTIDESQGIISEILEHGGDANGFACFYEFSPDKKYGIVMLSSSGGKWFRELGKNINMLLSTKYFRK